TIPSLFITWTGPEFVEVYDDVLRVIEFVRPGLVVVDSFFTPGHDAVRQLQMNHVVLSPTSIRDFITIDQPRGEAFWKFPITASEFPYPLPWHLIPSNILIWARLMSVMIPSCFFGRIHELTAYRKSHGIDNPVHPLQSLTQGSSILIASAPAIEYPIVIPPSIVPCGPILAEPRSLDAVDPDLASWLASAPTVLINLGSHVQYDKEKATNFARMITHVLGQTDLQILWKFNRKGIDYSTDFFHVLNVEVAGPRLRMVCYCEG
ncbi:UDP-glucoronosyl and UDP-glucosyl transferase, partial [Aspergillus sp. HF37]